MLYKKISVRDFRLSNTNITLLSETLKADILNTIAEYPSQEVKDYFVNDGLANIYSFWIKSQQDMLTANRHRGQVVSSILTATSLGVALNVIPLWSEIDYSNKENYMHMLNGETPTVLKTFNTFDLLGMDYFVGTIMACAIGAGLGLLIVTLGIDFFQRLRCIKQTELEKEFKAALANAQIIRSIIQQAYDTYVVGHYEEHSAGYYPSGLVDPGQLNPSIDEWREAEYSDVHSTAFRLFLQNTFKVSIIPGVREDS